MRQVPIFCSQRVGGHKWSSIVFKYDFTCRIKCKFITMVELLISITIFMLIHVSAMAVAMKLFGVKIKEVSYGAGPTLYRMGSLKFQPLPISGYVKPLDSRVDEVTEEEKPYAFNHQPVAIQVLAPLSGCIVVFVISYLVLGGVAVNSFLSAFQQIVVGALHPFSAGQEFIQKTLDFVQGSSLIVIVAVVQTKVVAFNLLPLPLLNGGQAIVNLLKMGRPDSRWEIIAANFSMFLLLILLIGWLLSVIYYVL